MTGKHISDQLSYLPDDIIEEAMEMPKRQRTLRFTARVLRAAACLAVIIGLLLGIWGRGSDPTAPQGGLLTITVYGSDLETIALLDTSSHWSISGFPNYVPGWPFVLSATHSNYTSNSISFSITASEGQLWIGKQGSTQPAQGTYYPYFSNYPISNDTTLYWNHAKIGYSKTGNTIVELFDGDVAYIDIIVYGNNSILGYCVIKIEKNNFSGNASVGTYFASVLASVLFSNKSAPDETITEEYIHQLIEEVKG